MNGPAAAAAKSLQSCPTLCDHIDGNPTRLPHPWYSPGKNTGVSCHFLLQCMKVKSLSRVRLIATPWTAAHQDPPPMGFFRQEYWSGVPLPSPVPYMRVQQKKEKKKNSSSFLNDMFQCSQLSLLLYGRQYATGLEQGS